MSPARSGISGGICDEGSYPHVVDDSAEVQCCAYDRIFEREISDTDIQGVLTGEAEFHGSSFLGTRILCEYSWDR